MVVYTISTVSSGGREPGSVASDTLQELEQLLLAGVHSFGLCQTGLGQSASGGLPLSYVELLAHDLD